MHFFSLICIATIASFLTNLSYAHSGAGDYWLEIDAKDQQQRSAIADLGFAIEEVHDNYVLILGSKEDADLFSQLGSLRNYWSSREDLSSKDFPAGDSEFHDHHEVLAVLDELQENYPHLVKINNIGLSIEGRIIPQATLTLSPDTHMSKPGIVFMGAHHAREHLSVEVPLRHLVRFCERYETGDPAVKELIETKSLYFIPLVNPDGKVHDIAGGNYKLWRKNRRLFGSLYGVDLNRNYGFKWGTGGSSSSPRSDVYMGPEPFSEPETRAVRDFVLAHTNLTTLLTYHTFGEMILYPWGHTEDSIGVNLGKEIDYMIHTRLAERMAEWNDYRPMQSSDLYVASGDTTDWSYGQLGLISFTFELDPRTRWRGGFYPGAEVIDDVVEKNWQPILYLTSYVDNPGRVLEGD